jgi:hypothetical protein
MSFRGGGASPNAASSALIDQGGVRPPTPLAPL